MAKKEINSIVRRYNKVMYELSLEDYILPEKAGDETSLSKKMVERKEYYGVQNGVTVLWLIAQASRVVAWYTEPGQPRYESRSKDEYCYRTWVKEKEKAKRLFDYLIKLDASTVIVDWNEVAQ